ncbi:MAG: TetR/AcrR family transcriptional regulator [Novosphingobium sp.]|uniref:TetR/AcrR family transcriptional regulator n=1 Tax=Tsuneonella sp. CC-YZS046 TaxID=3042152 RepID=UPI002D76FF67|nr:TetR/AcrR family transcriptional regulator [Tsuneonella sp. CC-YZS046]WRO66721.1 TetR/AcrR family transcriptional regulator [Tsuneonella sp. CC-YZS046]
MVKASNISKRRESALKEGSADYLAKRDELVRIAAQQFKQSGYRATTLAEIGHKAGLDRATVYYYFGSKEELFREILRTGVDQNIRECVKISQNDKLDSLEKLQAIIQQLMKAYDEHYPHMYVYIQEEMDRIASEKSVWAQELAGQTRKFEKIVMGLISETIAAGKMRDDIPVSIAANAIFGMLNWTHRWYQPGGAHGADEVSRSFARIFLDGMRPR